MTDIVFQQQEFEEWFDSKSRRVQQEEAQAAAAAAAATAASRDGRGKRGRGRGGHKRGSARSSATTVEETSAASTTMAGRTSAVDGLRNQRDAVVLVPVMHLGDDLRFFLSGLYGATIVVYIESTPGKKSNGICLIYRAF
jgi:hypothetical protein